MSYIPNPEFAREYPELAKNLKNFIPNEPGVTQRVGTKFITVLERGEEIIGVCDGCLITSHRVIDSRLIPGPPEELPRIPYTHSALYHDLMKTMRHLRAYPFLINCIKDSSGSDAT